MSEEKLFGKLFNSVPIYDENHLETILTTMDKKTACYMLIQAVKFAYHQGVYSIGESEVLSKSIRVYSKEDVENP